MLRREREVRFFTGTGTELIQIIIFIPWVHFMRGEPLIFGPSLSCFVRLYFEMQLSHGMPSINKAYIST